MTAHDLAPSLQAACARWPERPAISHRGRTITYAQLWDRVLALTGAYRSLGISAGDRVVCQLPTCPEHLIAAAAAWACGAVHVGAHRDLTPRELCDLVDRTGAAAVIAQPPPGLAGAFAPLRAVGAARPSAVRIGHGAAADDPDVHVLSELLAGPLPRPGPPGAGPHDPALLLRTSGTTGEPKLVEETLPALWAKVAFFAEAVEPGADDAHLVYLPIAHVFGLKLALLALASGGRLVLLDPFSPAEALRILETEGITVVSGSPTHLTLLVRHLEPDRLRSDRLRWAVTAAAPLPPGLVASVGKRLGADMLYVYGCSEGFLTRTADPGEIERGSVGSTVFRGSAATPAPPDGSVAVLGLDGGARLPAGQVGEIAFGTTRPVRYRGQPPAATDGWYRTGDLGWRDEDGLLFVAGRRKEVINRGGLKVASGEIEAVLAAHPAVGDCAVVPAADPVLGEAICACVVPAGERAPTLSEVREHLGGHLARHKLPDELCVVEAIPRSSVGKIDRAAATTLAADPDVPRQRLRRGPVKPHPAR